MWTHLITSFIGLLLLLASVGPPPSHKIRTAMYGAAVVNATDDFGGTFRNAANFAINAGIKTNGAPYGTFKLVGYGDFASAWGACPFDPRCEDFPNTNTQIFALNGRVTRVESAGGTIQISGLVSETDWDKDRDVIFHVDDDPFVITASEGSDSFVLQFCLVPPFTFDVAKGHLMVRTATAPDTLLQRPVAALRPGPLPCHAPLAR